MNKNKFIEKKKKQIKKHVINLHAFLSNKDFKVGECRWNFRCFYNAVHHTTTEKKCQSHLVFCVEKESDYCFLHVINQKNGKWIDNTLGYTYSMYDYYYIAPVPTYAENPLKTWQWFADARHEIVKPFISKKQKKKYNINFQKVI